MLKIRIGPFLAIGALWAALVPSPAFAWDEEGHKIIALIADHYLDPAVKKKVDAMLNADPDMLTGHDIASEAVWADSYRNLDRKTAQVHFAVTDAWHSLPIELTHPDIDAACNGHPALPAGVVASKGPAACSLDKVDQFAAELSTKATSSSEKLLALKYLLNLVGDLHQPLYVSDDHYQGGDGLRVSGGGAEPSTLRHYWDADFIDFLGMIRRRWPTIWRTASGRARHSRRCRRVRPRSGPRKHSAWQRIMHTVSCRQKNPTAPTTFRPTMSLTQLKRSAFSLPERVCG